MDRFVQILRDEYWDSNTKYSDNVAKSVFEAFVSFFPENIKQGVKMDDPLLD